MSDMGTGKSEQDLDELLPWYINQSLSPEEAERVEAYLETSEKARQEVEFLRNLRRQVKDISAARPPGEFGLKRLQRDISRGRQDRITKNYRARSRWWRPAAIAAAVVIAIQAGVILQPWAPSDTVTTAAGTSGQGTVLQVTLNPDATETEIRTLLQSIEGNIIGGPGSLGVYRIEIPNELDDIEGIKKAVQELQTREKIVIHVQRE
jgi:hypothetical protein